MSKRPPHTRSAPRPGENAPSDDVPGQRAERKRRLARGAPALEQVNPNLRSRRRPTAADTRRVEEPSAQEIVEAAATGLYVYDLKQDRYRWVNPTYAQITGYAWSALEGMSKTQFTGRLHPDDQPRLTQHLEHLRAAVDGEMVELEYRFQRADGQWILCLARDTVFERDRQGGVRQILGAVLDITERKEAELTLRNAEQRLRHFLQAVPIGVIRWRKDGAVLDANARFLEMVGYSWDDLHEGRVRWDAMTPPEWHQRTAEATAELQMTGRVYPFEKVYRRKDGGLVPVLLSAVVIDPAAGEGTAFVLDLTEQKRVEAELRQALAAKDAALADNVTLLREVHHRTKNNLQMLCDLLYLQAATLNSLEAKTVLEEAYGRIFAIARLHEQLYQSLGSGQISLGEYVGRLIAGFRSVYPQTRLTLEAPDDLALDVDRAIPLGLVVNELATNALKHAFPDGRRAEIRIHMRREAALIVLEVRDNGVGLPADVDLEHAKTLGLRIVRILADRLGASVRIENDGGAVFTLAFPVDPPESIAQSPA